MTGSDPTGYQESSDTTDGPAGAGGATGGDLVDGAPGQDPADRGERDTAGGTPLTTDDEAQHDDGPARPGNAAG
jgi:hypothetical protein